MRFSIILVDGFGNNLFQLSFLYQYARRHGIDHLLSVRIWNDQVFGAPAFGGHPRKKALTFGQIFPNLPYDDEKSIRDRDVCVSYVKHDSGYHDWNLELLMRKIDMETNIFVFSGWFFHYKYHQYGRREFIEWMRFSEFIIDRAPKLPYEDTISAHIRLGSPADSGDVILFDKMSIVKACETLKMEYPNLTHVMICSENRDKLEKYLEPSVWEKIGLTYVFLDDDVEVCLYAATKCAHHCLTNSTLSYMMAYMDAKFPEKSVAYYDNFNYLIEPVMDPELMKGFRKYPTTS